MKKKLKNKKAGMIDELEVNNILVQTTQSFLSYEKLYMGGSAKYNFKCSQYFIFRMNLKRSTRKCHEQ